MSSRTNAHAPATPLARREGGHVIEMQRQRLLLAMRELAGESGLTQATVSAVCKRSRVSRRTFYELFADRDACFLAAFEHAVSEISERIVPAWEQHERWHECLRAALQALLAIFDEQPQSARLCVIEALTGGPEVLRRRREILERLADAVDQGRGKARAADAPPPVTAESVVGGALAVIHARLLEPDPDPLHGLLPPLMSMIVLPYLGRAASRRQAQRPVVPHSTNSKSTQHPQSSTPVAGDPFRDLPIRFTYRTARVLAVIAADPGVSNREVGEGAGASDQGQMSKQLKRLLHAGLIENHGPRGHSGEPNAWRLTSRGAAVQAALGHATS